MAKIYFQTQSHNVAPQLEVWAVQSGLLGHIRYNKIGAFWAYYPGKSSEPLVSSSSLEQLKADIIGFEDKPKK